MHVCVSKYVYTSYRFCCVCLENPNTLRFRLTAQRAVEAMFVGDTIPRRNIRSREDSSWDGTPTSTLGSRKGP